MVFSGTASGQAVESPEVNLGQARIPGVSLAAVTGARLGVVGMVIQAIVRTPLAGPSILGFSSGAATGAVIVMRFAVIALSAFPLHIAVSVSGVIGFVGLIMPHIVRLLVGADHRKALPAVAFLQARYCGRMCLMHDGAMVAVGTPAQVLTTHSVFQVYNVEMLVQNHPRTGGVFLLPA